jgi:hypothetical protein
MSFTFLSWRVRLSCLIATLFTSIQCHGRSGRGSAPASLVGTIASGDTVSFNWTQWPNGHTGPVLTYMARVPDDEDARDWEPGKE